MQKDDNTLIAAFFAILPSLSQVLAVIAIAFDRRINITQYFYFDAIPLLNIFSLVISILTISLIYIFEYSPSTNGSNIEVIPAQDGKSGYIKNLENMSRRKFLWKFAFVTFASGTVLLFTMLCKLSGVESSLLLGFVQALSYIFFFVFTAGLIYTWIIFRLKKSEDWAPYKLVPNIKETLLKTGYIKKEDVQIMSAEEADPAQPSNTNRRVRCRIAGKEYTLIFSYRGDNLVNDETSYPN